MAIETEKVPSAEPAEREGASPYDEEASASVKKRVEELMSSVAPGNFDPLRQGIAPEASSFDYDFANKPTAVYGRDEWMSYVDTLEAGLRESGATDVDTKLTHIDAYATRELGFAAIEFEQSFVLEGKAHGPFTWRGTILLRREGDEWLMAHWHASPQQELTPVLPQ
jgi:hypothetical protein